MSDQRLPSTHQETVFWFVAMMLAVVITLSLTQRVAGIW